MRYAPVTLLLTVAALLGGCLTLQPPTITANSVSLRDVGRRGFSFPIPPGYQASSPEEFESLMSDSVAAYSQYMLRELREFQQNHSLSGKSVMIYRQESLVSGKPGTIIEFTYHVQSGVGPYDQHTALREQNLAREHRRISYEIDKRAKILSAEFVDINGRTWSKVAAVESNESGTPTSYYYIMATFGDLNEVYQFTARTFTGPLSDSSNVVDYMAEHMEI